MGVEVRVVVTFEEEQEASDEENSQSRLQWRLLLLCGVHTRVFS